MSSLWTPSGEHVPQRDEGTGSSPPSAPPRDSDGPTEQELADAQAQVEAMRAQLANTPAEVVLANHCYGLFELAAIYLAQQPPMLYQARLAIDGLSAMVTGLRGRLGEAEPALLDSLAQVQLAFVQLESVERTAGEAAAAASD
jgi:hypothetical protein